MLVSLMAPSIVLLKIQTQNPIRRCRRSLRAVVSRALKMSQYVPILTANVSRLMRDLQHKSKINTMSRIPELLHMMHILTFSSVPLLVISRLGVKLRSWSFLTQASLETSLLQITRWICGTDPSGNLNMMRCAFTTTLYSKRVLSNLISRLRSTINPVITILMSGIRMNETPKLTN